MALEDFLVDFYSQKTDKTLDENKIKEINSYYGDNPDSLITDLYSKYDPEGLDDAKLNEIKSFYFTDVKEPKDKKPVSEELSLDSNIETFDNIKLENFDNIEEEELVPELIKKYGKDFEITEQVTKGGYMYDQIYVENKNTGENTSIRLNTQYNRDKGNSNKNAYEEFISFVDASNNKSLQSLITENPIESTIESNKDYTARKLKDHKAIENEISYNINEDNKDYFEKAQEYKSKGFNPLVGLTKENARKVIPGLLGIEESSILNHSDLANNIASSYASQPVDGIESDYVVIPRKVGDKDYSDLHINAQYGDEILEKGYVIVDPNKLIDVNSSDAYMNIVATDKVNEDLLIFDGDSEALNKFTDNQLNGLFYYDASKNERDVYKYEASINDLRAKQIKLLNDGNVDEAKKYQDFITKADKELDDLKKTFNLGERIYDTETGTLIDINNASEGQIESDKAITDRAKSILNFEQRPTVDYLEDLRRKKFYQLKGLYSEMAGLSEDLEATSLGSGFDIGGRSKADYARYIDYFNKTGVVPKGLSKIFSEVKEGREDDPSALALAEKHDSILDDLAVLNRAIKLNVNALKAEETDFYDYTQIVGEIIGTENWSEVGEVLGAGKNPEMLAANTAAVIKASGLEVNQEVLNRDVNSMFAENPDGTKRISAGEFLVEGTAPLLKMVGAFAAARVVPGVAPTLKYLKGPYAEVWKKSFKGGKSAIYNKAIDFLIGGSSEVIKANIANKFLEASGEEKMPLSHAFFFGNSNVLIEKVSKKLLTNYIPVASEIFRAFSTTPVVKTVAGAAVAGTIPTTISKAIQAGEVIVGDWNDPKEKEELEAIYSQLTSPRQWAKEIIQFGALHVGGRPVKAVQNLVQGMKTNTALTRSAGKALGLKGVNSYEAIDTAYEKKLKELENNKELSKDELNKQKKDLLNKAEVLKTQKDISDAKDYISSEDNIFQSTKTQLEVVARKIASNEKLTVKEMELLDNLKTDGAKAPNRQTSLFISDVLGVDPTTLNFSSINATVDRNQRTGAQARQISDLTLRKEFVDNRSESYKVAEEITKARIEIENIQEDLKSDKNIGLPLEKSASSTFDKSILDAKIKKLSEKQRELAKKNIEIIGEQFDIEALDYKSDLDFSRSIAKDFGVEEIVEIETQDKWNELSSKNNEISKTADAVYSRSDNKVYVNRQKILGNKDLGEIGTGATSATTHELFHAFLKNSLKGEKGREKIDALVKSLPNSYQKLINRRFDNQYGKKPVEALYEEKLNIFLDLLKKNEVKQIKGVKERLANVFDTELNLSTGDNIGRVLNRFYEQSKNKKIDQGLLDLFAKEGSREIEGEVKYFESESKERSFNEDVDKALKITRDKDNNIELTKEEWDAGRVKDGIDLVNSGKFDAMIVEGTGKNKLKIIGNEIQIQGEKFSKDQFIIDVRDKLNDVVRNWDPQSIKGEKGGLAGWIFNPLNLNNKKLDVIKAYEKKALSDKAGRGEGKAEIELRVERPTEPFGAGRTNSLSMLNPEGRLELSNEIKSQLPTAEIMETFLGGFDNLIKDIPNLAGKVLAKQIGIPENKILEPKDNLSGPEASKVQRWIIGGGINPNYVKSIDLMPNNNVPVLREYAYKGGTNQRIKHPNSRKGENYINISASSGKINQPTGIDRNIKRDFFTKTDQRIGNDFLWSKNNFSEEYFLSKIGIKDRRKESSFTQRSSEAQTIKGVLRYVSKEMTLKALSERAQELGLSNQVNDLRSAKNVYAASESAIRDFDMPKQKDFLQNKISDIAQDFKINYAGVPTKAEIKSVVRKYLLDDFYSTKDKNNIADALEKGLKKAESNIEINKKVIGDIGKVDVESFLRDHVKEIIEGDFERINEDYLGLKRGELQKVSTDPEVQKLRRERDEAAWSDYMEKATDKFEAAKVLSSLTEQYTNTSTIGGKRHVYWGGTANWRSGLNKVLNTYGIKLEGTTLIEGKKRIKVKKYGGNFHNSQSFIKQAGLNSNSKVKDYKSKKIKETVEEYDKVSADARKFLESQILSETQAFMNGEIKPLERKGKSTVSAEAQMGIAMMALKNSMGSVLRLAAPIKGVYIPLPGEKLYTANSIKVFDAKGNPVYKRNKKGKFQTNKKGGKIQQTERVLVWEHNKSAEKMLLDLMKVYSNESNLREIPGTKEKVLNEKGKIELEKAYEDFYVNIIPYKMDGVIRRTGYEVLSPSEGTRYYNRSSMYDPNVRAIFNLKTGKIEGEAWAKAAEIATNPKLARENLKSDPLFAASESNTRTNSDFLKGAENNDRALSLAKKNNKKSKKIRVFDFDDTLARSKSEVNYTKLDGTTGKLTAEEFAKRGKELVDEGAVMDFSDFNVVKEGERGPVFEVAERIRDARGTEDVFVLTARAPESQRAIYEFLKSEGLEIPLENIVGLGNSTGEAKARWIVSKAAEGYNDFYFADDAFANVKAVKEALEPLDIKSKTQQVFASESENRSIEFNKILEQTTGVEFYKEYSAAKAKTIGASKGKFKFWIPYSAEDFVGLIYPTLGKGKVGDGQMAWYKKNLLNPYSRAMDNLSRDRVQLMADFKALKKELDVPKDLRKTNDTGMTNEQAVRVYLFDKAGYETPGLSKADKAELLDVVNKDTNLKTFADQILSVTKGDGYAKPGENWTVGTITTDLIDLLNTTKRNKYLEEWKQNIDQIYSKENLNKLEAIYGPKYRESLENIISRMKSGKNRLTQGNRLSNRVLDYINGSNAAIMFFNTRSAILQTISSINFVNWSFNNPLKAGAAFANQKQYWSDFTKLMNSDYLLDRRNGLRLNIAESEIADAAATSKNKVKGAVKYILEKGYLPTQYADSFAIASGGATFYRNRVNDLVKNEGKSIKEAETQAMVEWRQVSEESQQSSNPSKISSQQASDAGRLILMFANTPMQYARLQKRALQDLANGRGDAKSNVSKIIYYSFVQNMIFNSLQQALFKLGFDDEEDDATKNKAYFKTANGMIDSQLRGLGIGGAAVSVGKNFLLDIYERSGRKRPEYVDAAWKLTQFSPPISSKISRIKAAAYPFDNKKQREEIYSKGFSLDNPAAMSGAKVVSATTNIPLDRVLQKYDNVEAAMSEEADVWQSIAMMAGWPKWSIMDDKGNTPKPKTKEEKAKIKLDRANQKYKAATGSTDFETVKKLNRKQQMEMIKKLGVSRRKMNYLKKAKEQELIEYIIEKNKEQ